MKKTLQSVETLTFSKALELLKEGKKMKRVTWNGKDQYIFISKKVVITDLEGKEHIAENNCFGSKVIVFVNPKLGMQVGWLASQADILSEDWIEAGCEVIECI